MSLEQNNELRVGNFDNAKRVMYLAKEKLLTNETIEVYSGTNGAPVVSRACETLVRLNYVTVADVRTETNIVEGTRRIKFVMRLTKTADFQRLFDENEVNRKLKQEEREKAKATATPTPTPTPNV